MLIKKCIISFKKIFVFKVYKMVDKDNYQHTFLVLVVKVIPFTVATSLNEVILRL